MAVVVPWLQPPDFIGAARSGAQIGLSEADMHQQAAEHAAELALKRDQLSAEMSHLASENQARREQQNAALELRREVLKQQGLLGSERNQNQADALTARTELEKTRLNKPTFANTGSGLFERDPVTGAWNAVPGTSKPAKEPLVKIATGVDESGKSILENIPASQALKALQGSGYAGWSKNPHNQAALAYVNGITPQPTETATNQPSAAEALKSPASAGYSSLGAGGAINPTDVPLPDSGSQFKKGQRAVQNGVTYEFDGQNWNEVNQ
jgi:hypothetical protein